MLVIPEDLKENCKNSASLKYFQVNESHGTKALFSLPSALSGVWRRSRHLHMETSGPEGSPVPLMVLPSGEDPCALRSTWVPPLHQPWEFTQPVFPMAI